MKIEAGKFYKTRDGEKVGPMFQPIGCSHYVFYQENYLSHEETYTWYDGGEAAYDKMPHHNDLVAEWPAGGPIRTRREIVPGDYGKIRVKNSAGTNIAILDQWRAWTSEELREAAHLFNQLAEVLEENQ